MNRHQILIAIENLAMSQGFYGRLLEQINEADEETREKFLSHLEDQCFADAVDLAIYLES